MLCVWAIISCSAVSGFLPLSTASPSADGRLIKKYTLRLPMSFPIGGKINPMAGVCTEGVNLVLSRVNSQQDILPDFNVVADIIDDQCRPDVGGQRVLQELETWASNYSVYGDMEWKTKLPDDPELWSKPVFTPPVLVGSLCSGVCRAIARFPRHYNVIELATGCIIPILDNRERYPNFYRLFRSSKVFGLTRVSLIESLGFTKVAILSTTIQFGYHDSLQFMQTLAQHGIETVAEEFYQTDPTEAIDRLMASDVRVIFANCYTNTCPFLACTAYRKKYYGPNVVWIFNSEVYFLNKGSAGTLCRPEMLEEFAQGALFLGVDMTAAAYSEPKSLFGITAQELATHLMEKAPDAMKTRAAAFRIVCFDIAENAIAILDQLDKKLKRGGASLVEWLQTRPRSVELMEEVRDSVVSVNIPTIWGRKYFMDNITYGAINLPLAQAGPPMVVRQVQGSQLRSILVENVSVGIGQLIPLHGSHFIWGTSDGAPPKSEPILETIQLRIALPAVIVVRIVAAIALIVQFLSIFGLFHLRKRPRYENSMTWINIVISLGPIFALLAVMLYPTGESGEVIRFGEFCTSAFFLVIFGCTLTFGGLVAKMAIPFFSKDLGAISTFPKTQKKAALFLLVWSGLNVLLLIILNVRNDSRVGANTISHSPAFQLLTAKTVTYTWEVCHSTEFILGWVLICCQVVCGGGGLMLSMLMRGDTPRVYISDVGISKICLYLAFPIPVALLLVKITLNSYVSAYVVLAFQAFSQAVVVVGTLTIFKVVRWGTKPSPDHDLVRAQELAKTMKTRRTNMGVTSMRLRPPHRHAVASRHGSPLPPVSLQHRFQNQRMDENVVEVRSEH